MAVLPNLDWPLMRNNISKADLAAVVALLEQDEPILTQSGQVREFEREWSEWLGVGHSVFVNSLLQDAFRRDVKTVRCMISR